MRDGSGKHGVLYERNRWMNGWKSYIISAVVCSLSCGLATQMVTGLKQKELIRFVCGILLSITVLSPVIRIHPEECLKNLLQDLEEPDFLIAEGEKLAKEQQLACIKEACETYILDRSKAMGVEISIQISLDTEGIPIYAEINGKGDSEVQLQLQTILTTDLGIPKEHQQWIWKQESNSS